MSWPKSILTVSPVGFRVEYAINPFMRDATGRLKVVDSKIAKAQWEKLGQTYRDLGLQVEALEGHAEFPDMVFCANPFFPFVDRDGKKSVMLSRMKAKERQGEIPYFRQWAEGKGFRIYESPAACFEGCGDAIWNYETHEIYGGYGARTEAAAYDELEHVTGRPVHRLKICDPQFYHLDTCFAILRGDVVAFVEEAFDQAGLELLTQQFRQLVRIQKDEALTCFAGNCFSPNGKDVLLHPGAYDLVKKLGALDFTLHEVDTSEFMKSGGSVFCMKQALF